MQVDLLKFEKELYEKGITLIAGCDEAGRGPLCGPVVCAAVILPKNYTLEGLNDSKKLTEKQREKFYPIIMKDALAVGVSIVEPDIIDEINILEASRFGMKDAVSKLSVKPEFILTDAMDLRVDNCLPIIKGDAKSINIAAASVIAKVTRDHIMYELDKKYPCYELAKHKGYPTKRHFELIAKYGIVDIYRKSFKPVKAVIERSINGDEIK